MNDNIFQERVVLSIVLDSNEKIILKPKNFPSRVKNHSEKSKSL